MANKKFKKLEITQARKKIKDLKIRINNLQNKGFILPDKIGNDIEIFEKNLMKLSNIHKIWKYRYAFISIFILIIFYIF